MTARGYFIAGTDTGVGKTEIACGLIRACVRNGHAVAAMKPIAAGAKRVRGRLRNSDVEQLRAASNVRAARRFINPYVFAPPIAPHIAAERARVQIDADVIVRAYRELARRADIVIVEGVGGLLVPLNGRCDGAHLARRLGLPIVLVVGMRLGCLSHALLSASAIASRGLRFAGWVANRTDSRMRAYRDNVEALRARLAAPLLGEIAYRSSRQARRAEIDRVLAACRITQ